MKGRTLLISWLISFMPEDFMPDFPQIPYLEDMKDQNDVKLVAVFEGEPWQVTMMQNVLVENDIPAFIKNGLMGSIEPWAVTSGGLNPTQLMVSDLDREVAAKIIEEFNQAEHPDE